MVESRLINHTSYGLAEREHLSGLLSFDKETPHVCLATCNRIEYYWGKGSVPETITRHLCRVASGLESALTGERAIQGQVKQAYAEASQQYRLSSALHRLFQTAIHTGKRVRTETRIAQGAVSHSQVTVELLKQHVRDLQGKVISLIGVNKLSEDILKFLSTQEALNIYLSNRNMEKARAIAAHYQGEAFAFDKKREFLALTDILICSTSAPHTLIRREDIPDEKEMLIIDLAFPRDVEESVGKLNHVKLYNLEDIEGFAHDNLSSRRREIEKAEEIIEEEIARFYRWQSYSLKLQTI